MRTYASRRNLLRAAAWSLLVTIGSLPRLLLADVPMAAYLPATFLLMTLVCAAVTAWSRYGGMAGLGLRPAPATLAIAALLAAATWPLQRLWIDPAWQRLVLTAAAEPPLQAVASPHTPFEVLASVLWCATFQVMFLQAAPMSLGARLTRRKAPGIAGCVLLRAYIFHRQVTYHGFTGELGLLFLASLATVLIGCWIFARYGLVASMTHAAILELHAFWPPPA